MRNIAARVKKPNVESDYLMEGKNSCLVECKVFKWKNDMYTNFISTAPVKLQLK